MPKRKLKHPEYYAIKGYQILFKLSDEEMAKKLKMSVRSYRDKRTGYSDFSISQGDTLSELFQKPKDEIFLT